MAPLLQPRQANTVTVLIPSTYGNLNSGPSPGTIVGIVLGSVAGFLLLLWLLYTCFSGTPLWGTYDEKVIVRDKKRRSRGHASTRRASETVEVRMHEHTAPPPIRIVRQAPPPERVERVVVEERRETRRERRGGDDEVVVIEDHSPPRRSSKSKRESRREIRDEAGFRTVDPGAYAGIVGGRRK